MTNLDKVPLRVYRKLGVSVGNNYFEIKKFFRNKHKQNKTNMNENKHENKHKQK